MGGQPRLGLGSRMTVASWPGVYRAMSDLGFAANAIQNSMREVVVLDDLLTPDEVRVPQADLATRREAEELLRRVLPEVLALEPKSRLARTAQLILDYDLTRYEIAVRQWALHDAKAARVVRNANRLRLNFVRGAFAELGFTGDDLEMRTLLFVGYHTWETPMFRDISSKRRRELIAKRIELLTRR